MFDLAQNSASFRSEAVEGDRKALSAQELIVRSFGATDVGRRRQTNQDAFLCDDEVGVWLVADGMGGHAAGEVASREAVDTVHGMLKRERLKLGHVEGLDAETAPHATRLMESSIQAATYMVYGMAELDTDKAGMGTTISGFARFGRHGVFGQVGDSRLYRIRGGQATQLTEDHTLVNWQIKQGLITPEQAKTSRHRNVITRAVGNREYVQVDTGVVALDSGDHYLLCSDGLHGYLQDAEIPQVLGDGGGDAVRRFIDLANARGGKDNITAVLIEVF
jgi:protein phosphatase